MPLKESIEFVLGSYLKASQEDFKANPVANFLRHDFPDSLVSVAGEHDRLIYKGSAGQGVWAKGPWVGIFDPLITTTPQSGYYPVYLFCEDMHGVYLSLNQGMTEAKALYKSDAKTALRARAANYRAMLGSQITQFPDLTIDLSPSAQSNDTAFYEAGNICAKFYPAGQVPNEAVLISDLANMLQLYQSLLEGETSDASSAPSEGDEPVELHYEDATKFRIHKRIERNSNLSKEVKKRQGYVCQVCSTNFEKTYGEIGKEYIEAHHLKPISSLKGTKVALDPVQDFAVLCANCHRMIHRSGCLDDIEKFKAEHYQG